VAGVSYPVIESDGGRSSDESAATIVRYTDFDWPEVVVFWVSMNRLPAHVRNRLP
jgi:hypothetical protein